MLTAFPCRYFMYDGLKHSCIEGDHVVNIFSFSKAYGMMGWRVGYVSNAQYLLLLSIKNCCTIVLSLYKNSEKFDFL